MTDQELSAAQTDRFEQLVWPLLPGLLRSARFLTRRDAQADDLVQDTMFKALRFIDSYEEGTNVRAWLMTILRHTHIDTLRAGRRRAADVSIDAAVDLGLVQAADAEPECFDDQWAQPEQLLERFEDQAVIEALQGLPEDIRWTLLLVDVEQIDHAEAARILEVPVGTIKSRAFRGRRMLRDHLFVVARDRGWVSASQGSKR
jgi:RNA polymerase sigma-70 factor (ECF subfamily)